MARLEAHAQNLLATEQPVIWPGIIMLCRRKLIVMIRLPGGDALWHPQSRAAFFRLAHKGYSDAIRAIHPIGAQYSYWDYQAGAWQRDNGIRIDHLMLSPEAADKLINAGVDKTPRGLERPSDHTPVWIELAA